ncbi:MAG: TonB-dependent receptor, partial [Candidatus Eremiobacteraeota bacterium]|nr:TonB-dependent receptor [Candidatus Eremiobacteraeota bacterium]
MSFAHVAASPFRLVRLLLVCAAVCGIVGGSTLPAFAAGGQLGNLTGTVIDAQTKAPIANATVNAAAPTGSYTSRTDAHGFFSILGMVVDTYSVSVQAAGYEPQTVAGITIQGDQTVSLPNVTLAKVLRTIGRVTARSASSVFQPRQTVDSYQVTGERLLQTTGKAAATNLNNLVQAVPGVTLTSSNAPTIRGGLRTEVGYQYDGVDFTEPFFAQSASNGRFSGIGSVQVVEGAGDATQGNIGGGVVNLIPKRGTIPPFGYVDAEVGGPNYFHQFAFEYGFATPNGRFSDYIAYTGQRNVPYLGYSHANAAAYDNYYGNSYEANDDLVNNFVYKFGKENNQSLQVLTLWRDLQQWGNAGGLVANGPLAAAWYPNDPFNQVAAQLASQYPGGLAAFPRLVGLNPDTPQSLQLHGPVQSGWNPTRYLKLEYDNNFNSTTFLQAKYYNWETLQGTSNDTGCTCINAGSLGLGAAPVWSETGGPKVGGRIDLTKQFSSKHTVTVDALYENAHPIWNEYDPQALTFLLLATGHYSDFLPGGAVYQHFNGNVPRIPNSGINYNGAFFQNFGVGIREQWAPNDKWKADVGVRWDGQNQHYGPNPLNPTLPNNPSDVTPASIGPKYLNPRETEPRVALNYVSDPANSFRFGYGRSVVFLVAQTAGTPAGFYNYGPFTTMAPVPGLACGSGVSGAPTVKCQNYAQQLYWL